MARKGTLGPHDHRRVVLNSAYMGILESYKNTVYDEIAVGFLRNTASSKINLRPCTKSELDPSGRRQ